MIELPLPASNLPVVNWLLRGGAAAGRRKNAARVQDGADGVRGRDGTFSRAGREAQSEEEDERREHEGAPASTTRTNATNVWWPAAG